ncbi:MAG: hypothetical protein D6701_03095, partial [Gemmatimonadetes bacterium]
LIAFAANPASAQMMKMAEDAHEAEFTATVVDLSCKVVYGLTGEDHRMCSQVCADNGIPLGLLSEDGQFYLPVSDAMPGKGANETLKPHAEHKVRVKGKVIERAGMNTIIIESIEMAD